MPPPRMRLKQEREADMGRNKGEGRIFLADGKTRPERPHECDIEWRGPRPSEWQKTPEGIAKE